MANGQFTPQAIQNRILAGGTQLFRQGAQALGQAAAGGRRRRGIAGAAELGRQVTEGLAPALGQTALRAGQVGEQLGAEFEKQQRGLEFAREELAQRKAIEDARLAQMAQQHQAQLQMQLFPHTGFTRPLLEGAGLGGEQGLFGGPSAFRGFQRELGRLGLPGQPFGGGQFGGRGGGQFGLSGLGAATNLQLQRQFPGMSRAGRFAMAQRFGLFGPQV